MSTTILWENDAKAMPGKRRSGSARLVAGALLLLGTTTPLAAQSRLYVLEPDKAYPPPEA